MTLLHKLGLVLCGYVATVGRACAQAFLECDSLEGCSGCVCPAEPLGCYDFNNNPGQFNAAFEGTVTTDQCFNYTWDAQVDSFLASQGFFNLNFFSNADESFSLFFTNNDGRANKGWGVRYEFNYWFQTSGFGDQTLTGPLDLGAKNVKHTVCLVRDGLNFDLELDGTLINMNSGGPLFSGPPISSNIPLEEKNVSLSYLTFNVFFGNGQCLDDFNMTLFLEEPTPAPTQAPSPIPTAAPTQLPVPPTHPFLQCGSLAGCSGCVCPAEPLGCYDFNNNPGQFNAAFEGSVTTDQCFRYSWDANVDSFLSSQGFFDLSIFATADGSFNLFFTNNDGRSNKGWAIRYAGNYWFQTAGFGNQLLTGPLDLGAKNVEHTICLVLDGLNFDLELDGTLINLNSGGPLGAGPPITSDIPLERYNVSLSFLTFNVFFGTGQCIDDFNMTLFLDEPTPSPTSDSGLNALSLSVIGLAAILQFVLGSVNLD